MPHESDSNYHEGTTLSLSEPARVSIHMYCTIFPPNKHFTCFTIFRLYVEIHFFIVDGPGPCHWSLVPVVWWLGFRALTATARPHSLVGNRNPASSLCRPRPPEITPRHV